MLVTQLFILLLFVSCKSKKQELIPFPIEFYNKCSIDKSKHLFFIVTGDNLYSENTKKMIDSLVISKVNTKKYITITLYKEGRNFSRKDFGQNYEPFGNEWESFLGDYRYSVYKILNKKIIKKKLYDTRSLIELNGKKIKRG